MGCQLLAYDPAEQRRLGLSNGIDIGSLSGLGQYG